MSTDSAQQRARLRLAKIFAPRPWTLKRDPDSKEDFGSKLDINDLSRSRRYWNHMREGTPENREDLYNTYADLDEYTEVSVVLDSYAEEATLEHPQTNKVVWVNSPIEGVAALGDDMLTRIGASEKASSWIRDMARDGDLFLQVFADADIGVEAVVETDPRTVERVESQRSALLGFLHSDEQGKKWSSADLDGIYKPWDFIHFRLFNSGVKSTKGQKGQRNMYGTSLLKVARVPMNNLKISKDMLQVYRLTNTLDRRKFGIDVGTSADEIETTQKLRRWMNAMKREVYRNPTSGEFDIMYNPLGMTDDVFFPTHKESATTVDVIPGQPNIYDAYDVDLLTYEAFAALRARPEWYGFGEPSGDDQRSFGSRSVQFARMTSLLQKYLCIGLARLLQIHYALLGLNVSPQDFEVCMTPSSPWEVLERLEVLQTVIDAAERMVSFGDSIGVDKEEWNYYIMSTLFSFSEAEIDRFLPPVDDDVEVVPVGSDDVPIRFPAGEDEPPSAPPVEGEPEQVEPLPASVSKKRNGLGKRLNEGAMKSILEKIDPGLASGTVSRGIDKVAFRAVHTPVPSSNREVQEAIESRLQESVRKEKERRKLSETTSKNMAVR
jgi:hypothetical protein